MISKERAIRQFLDHLNDFLNRDTELVAEARYNADTNQFFVRIDTWSGTATYPLQFDSDRIYGDMTLNDFVNECEIFIEEVKVENGCAIVRSYK